MISKIDTSAIDSSIDIQSDNLQKTRALEVSKALKLYADMDTDLVGELTQYPANWFKVDGIKSEEVAVNLHLSQQVAETIREDLGFFSIKKHLEGHFGESLGSSNVTTLVVKYGLTPSQVIQMLEANGDLYQALDKIEGDRKESDPDAELILAYALWRFAMGWDAERLLSTTDDFNKGSAANDKGGIDGYMKGNAVQVKPAQFVQKEGRKEVKKMNRDHIAYLFDPHNGQMWVADMDEFNKMTTELKKGVPVQNKIPLMKDEKKVDQTAIDRSYRVLWY